MRFLGRFLPGRLPWFRHGLFWPLLAMILASGCRPLPAVRPPTPPRAEPETEGAPFFLSELGGKTVLMHYMPWYKTPGVRDGWGPHWTGHERQHNPDALKENGLPDIWSHYHPLIGLYDSTDPAVLECQLLEMKLAGVNGVIPDWYGIHPTADYPEIHEATQRLVDMAGRLGMTFAICYEDRSVELLVNWGKLSPDQVTNHMVETFAWMQKEWFERPSYQRLNERPLLLNFGPVYVTDPGPWQAAMAPLPVRPMFFGLHHLWRNVGADGGFTWVHYDPWQGNPTPETIRTRIGEVFSYFSPDPSNVIVSACPNFHDVYAQSHPRLEHRDGQTLQELLDVALGGPWSVVQLVTWNDYGEGTMFEPTHEFGYLFLEILQAARRQELGEAFAFTPDDLRLPAMLLALRKQGDIPAKELDGIALLLSRGETAAARAALREWGAAVPPGPLLP